MSSQRIPFSNLSPTQKASRVLLAVAQELQGPDELLPKEVKQFQATLSKADTVAFRQAFAAIDQADDNPEDDTLPDSHKSVFQASFDLLRDTGRVLEDEYNALPNDLKKSILAFSEDADTDLKTLKGGASANAKAIYFLVSAGLIGASEAGIANSLEAAFKIRASATNAMWLVEAIAIATSPTGNLRQFIHALVMRLGVGLATQVVGAIRIAWNVSDAVWIRPSIIIPNLAAVLSYVVAPTLVKAGQNVIFRRNAGKVAQEQAADPEAQLTIDVLPLAKRHFDILKRIEAAETLNTPNNSTKRLSLLAKTSRKRVITNLKALLSADQAASLPSFNVGASKLKKLPSGVYILTVVAAQLGSSFGGGNKQTFLDNITFAVFISWIYGVLVANDSASPQDTQVEVTAYSSGMLLAVFCAASVMLSEGQDVFEKRPELLKDMAITIVMLNLTVAKQFVPFFELLMGPKKFVQNKRKDWAKKLSRPAQGDGPDEIAMVDMPRGASVTVAERPLSRSPTVASLPRDASVIAADVPDDETEPFATYDPVDEWRRILITASKKRELHNRMETEESEPDQYREAMNALDEQLKAEPKLAALLELRKDAMRKPSINETDEIETMSRRFTDQLSLAETAKDFGVPEDVMLAGKVFDGAATEEEQFCLLDVIVMAPEHDA